MKRFKSKLKFDILWVGPDGKPQIFRPYIYSNDGDWKIPILGMRDVYEVWAGKNDRRIIRSESFIELPPTLKGRILIIIDKYHFLNENRIEVNELLDENNKLKDTIEDLKLKLIEAESKRTDLKSFAELMKEARKESKKEDKEIIYDKGGMRRRF